MFDSVGDVEIAVAKLIASERPVDVRRLARVRNQLEYAWLRAVDDYSRSGEWVDDGYVNAASGLRERCGLTQATAHGELNLAHKLRALPVVSEAFADGELSRAHVRAIADAFTPQRAAAIGELESLLVDAARAATPRQLRQIVDRVVGALDGDDGASLANSRYDRRFLHLSETFEGMYALNGLLDHENGRKLKAWIDRRLQADRGTDDARTPAQRRADALVELAEAGAACVDAGPGRNALTDTTVVIDIADLEARGGRSLAREIRQHAGALPRATLRRITCDARVARVITDGPSEVLDVGRATRTIPTAIWRALVARDGGCSYEGCDRPPAWTDAHHITHWVDGGATCLANLRLLCRRHHRMVHEGGHDPPRA